VATLPLNLDITPEQCGDAIRQIADLALFAPVFAEFICYEPILTVLEALFDDTEFSFRFLCGRPKAARVSQGFNWHRDSPFEKFTSANLISLIVCLDDMNPENGPLRVVAGSHKVSDEEAKEWRWASIEEDELPVGERVEVCAPAGSGVFFSSKIIHGSRHNRSSSSRRNLLMEWAGPDTFPTSEERDPYQGLMPRSTSPARQQQVRMTFPNLFSGRE
jgi:ectoine hydroxylase-related dioxygenase (phytanoyl-CoA dioxygenase family)